MTAVLEALLVGLLVGALARPFLDAYLNWKRAQFSSQLPVDEDILLEDPLSGEQ